MIGLKLFNLSSSFFWEGISVVKVFRTILFLSLITVFLLMQTSPTFGSSGLQQVVQKVRGSVVTVITNTSTGTGFIIVPSGHVVTCEHVVGNSGSIRIKNSSGVTSPARVIHKDKPNDIAVLEIQGGSKISKLSLAKKNPSLGEEIFVIGTPKGLEQTLSKGIISSVRTQGGINFIQFDAAVSSGSSGSPVFNMNGEVVGIVQSTVKDSQNLNFALASDSLGSIISRSPKQPQMVTPPSQYPQDTTPKPLPTSTTKASENIIKFLLKDFLRTGNSAPLIISDHAKNYLGKGFPHYLKAMDHLIQFKDHVRYAVLDFQIFKIQKTPLSIYRDPITSKATGIPESLDIEIGSLVKKVTEELDNARLLQIKLLPIEKHVLYNKETVDCIIDLKRELEFLRQKMTYLNTRIINGSFTNNDERTQYKEANQRYSILKDYLRTDDLQVKIKERMSNLYDFMLRDLEELSRNI